MSKSQTIGKKIEKFFTYNFYDSSKNEIIKKVTIKKILFVGALVAMFLFGTAVTGAVIGTGVFGLWGGFLFGLF